MSYAGDITLGDTIHCKFSTVATTGAPTTLAGTPAVSAYVGGSLTQITAGVTLTVDYDGVTGLNDVTVVASGANGFTTATNVSLVITTGTVGGTSVVGYVVGSFSIGNRAAFARLGAPAGASVSADVAAVKAETALIVADTNELQADWANGGRLDLILDARASQASVDVVDGIVDDILLDTAVIGAAGAGLTALATAANLATVDTVVDAIKAKTDSLTFTTAGIVDANIQQINDVTITGDGAPGTEFGVT